MTKHFEDNIEGYTSEDIRELMQENDRFLKENEGLRRELKERTSEVRMQADSIDLLNKKIDEILQNWNRDNNENRKLIDNVTRQANALYQVILKLGGYDQK